MSGRKNPYYGSTIPAHFSPTATQTAAHQERARGPLEPAEVVGDFGEGQALGHGAGAYGGAGHAVDYG
jgi:hypothetical protein